METLKLDFAKGGGLLPAIILDYQTKKVLMFAYLNQESYRLTLETREMWYWSRTRQALWHKGAESGHLQKVKKIRTDCDCDTLLIEVEQLGVACHTGAKSCFFRQIWSADSDDDKEETC
ncbi:phosphoribosyl-AMP cyclohydrolase [Streptococcus oricebi]|uniref:Phosphoribosyl-AMP cyclohydrolase n=1 Tax=Streptococcus oricebi TaxID=1547447 RepID=A0ABS5B171_9STRE|nr:phosphoribosyl-AMP cyclohydrolase [Streptococcus oricebi]MBP2622575.1 phosphoribosyl-AMP cyclohydrolase [Streptococcus oricebi]